MTTATIRVTRGAGARVRVELPYLELRVEAGAGQGRRRLFCLPTIRVGAHRGNDFRLEGAGVSRFHLEVRAREQGFDVADLGSRNGTLLAGEPITFHHFDGPATLVLGETTLAIRPVVDAASAPVPEVGDSGWYVGASAAAREVSALVETVASGTTTVLLEGESGTGKELLAEELHRRSGRAGDLVVVDCGVADPALIRSDLFGHEAGAYTGAAGARAGAFRAADGGTLFLDEVGELPLELQPQLLRALETRAVTPLGRDRPVRVDVRVVAATHRDLVAMVSAGTFRNDLYHRLAVLPMAVPPLRDRPEDIAGLAALLAERMGTTWDPTPEALAALRDHPWPGNVRELRNVVERAGLLAGGGRISPEHLRLRAAPAAPGQAPRNLRDLERDAIMRSLERHGGHQERTAKDLGISLSTLRRRLKEYDAEP